MNKDKILSLAGFCSKSGNCIFGESKCLNAVRGNKTLLLFLDEDSSENTKKRFINACGNHITKLIFFNKDFLDIPKATGNENYKIIAIKNKLFAEQLIKLFNSDELHNKARTT